MATTGTLEHLIRHTVHLPLNAFASTRRTPLLATLLANGWPMVHWIRINRPAITSPSVCHLSTYLLGKLLRLATHFIQCGEDFSQLFRGQLCHQATAP